MSFEVGNSHDAHCAFPAIETTLLTKLDTPYKRWDEKIAR